MTKMKKNTIILSAITTVTAVSLGGTYFMKYNSLRSDSSQAALPEGFTVTAHTGCEKTADNTLGSITAGVKAKADIVEIDLHFLPDGTPVLSHNTPSGAKKLPTLEEAFSLLSTLDIKMNVDVKSTANIPEVLTLAEKHGVTDKIFFTGVEEKYVEAVRKGAPDVPYFLNFGVEKNKNTDAEYLASLINKVKACGAVGINMNFRGASKQLVEAFRKEGLLVSLWTANKKSEMYRCLVFEPDNITTRKPSGLIDIMLGQNKK